MDRSRDVTGKVNIVSSLFFLKVQAERRDVAFQKLFRGDISLHLLNILKHCSNFKSYIQKNKKFQKLYFDFSCRNRWQDASPAVIKQY